MLARLGRAYKGFALDEPDAYRVMFGLDQEPHGVYPEVDRQATRGFSFLLRTVQAGVESNDFRGDPLTIAQVRWATIHGIVSLHLAGKLVTYKQPRGYEFVAEPLRDDAGKVRRTALRDARIKASA